MGARIFLGLNAAMWIGYGLYCFVVPGSLAEGAGVAFTNATGSTELRAMYGGLQVGIGALAAAALVRRDLVRPALVALAFLAGGLFLARISGSTLDQGWSQYTGMALALEVTITGVSIALLRRAPAVA
jgi:hypothetical protein